MICIELTKYYELHNHGGCIELNMALNCLDLSWICLGFATCFVVCIVWNMLMNNILSFGGN